MAAIKPFQGYKFLKDELIRDIRTSGALARIWLNGPPGETRFALLEEIYTLPSPLLRLVSALAGNPNDPEVIDFVATLLESLSVDSAVEDCTEDWLTSVWAERIEPHIANSSAHEAATAILDLIRTSAETKHDRSVWRAANRCLVLATGLSFEQADYVEVVQAMAWDLGDYPGAIVDVVRAMESAAERVSYRSNGWDDAASGTYNQMFQEMEDLAIALVRKRQLGQPEMAKAMREELEKQFDAHGHGELYRQARDCRKKAIDDVAACRRFMRATLLNILRG